MLAFPLSFLWSKTSGYNFWTLDLSFSSSILWHCVHAGVMLQRCLVFHCPIFFSLGVCVCVESHVETIGCAKFKEGATDGDAPVWAGKQETRGQIIEVISPQVKSYCWMRLSYRITEEKKAQKESDMVQTTNVVSEEKEKPCFSRWS